MFFFFFCFQTVSFVIVKLYLEMKLILYFSSLAAWLSFRHREGRVQILAIECVSFSFCYSLLTVLAFFHDQTHTHANKEGGNTRGKAEKRQRAVRFTRFLDRMFYSGRLFTFIQTFIVLQRGYHHARRLTKMKINKMHQSLCNIKIHYD